MTGTGKRAKRPAGRGLGGPVALLLLGLWVGVLSAATVGGGGVAQARPSVRDSPGYYATPDPESMSVVIGRRLNAPAVRKPFHGGARSLDDLGRAMCRAIHHGQRDSLLELCVTDDEFSDILWREFPQSRPAMGLTWEDAWRILCARLHAGCSHAVRDLGGHSYEYLRFEPPDSIARYRNFKLYSGLTLIARDDEGRIEQWSWVRAVAERKGVFKIYSTED